MNHNKISTEIDSENCLRLKVDTVELAVMYRDHSMGPGAGKNIIEIHTGLPAEQEELALTVFKHLISVGSLPHKKGW